MVRFKILPLVLAFAALSTCCARSAAQSSDAPIATTPANAKPILDHPVPTPFPPGAALQIARSIELRAPDAMAEQDRRMEADAESSIAERAGYADIAFNEGKWTYSQLVCPALPNHLFLRFTRNNGAGDVSLFSVSIPRNGEGRLRIIPIERRGYSLFSPAPVNALTIAAFNHIRTEDQPDNAGGEAAAWLGTALCYAALAGANPLAAPDETTAGARKFPAASAPVLEIPPHGGAVIRFTDMSATPRPMAWSLAFNGKGKLLKASHAAAGLSGETPIPVTDPAQTAKTIPGN